MGSIAGFITLLIVISSAIAGLLIFTRGFLLNRVAITNTTQASGNSVRSARYNKAIVLVIDALRYDFVTYQRDSNSYHHNKLQFVNSLLQDQSEQTRLYKFVADPPTTTMQRLKGLTTGSLPTFVDAGVYMLS